MKYYISILALLSLTAVLTFSYADDDEIEILTKVFKTMDIDSLIEKLSDIEHPKLRQLAAQELGHRKKTEALSPLIKRLTNESNPQIKQVVVEAIGTIGAPLEDESLKNSLILELVQLIINDKTDENIIAKARLALSKIGNNNDDLIVLMDHIKPENLKPTNTDIITAIEKITNHEIGRINSATSCPKEDPRYMELESAITEIEKLNALVQEIKDITEMK